MLVSFAQSVLSTGFIYWLQAAMSCSAYILHSSSLSGSHSAPLVSVQSSSTLCSCIGGLSGQVGAPLVSKITVMCPDTSA